MFSRENFFNSYYLEATVATVASLIIVVVYKSSLDGRLSLQSTRRRRLSDNISSKVSNAEQ
jgi:hypothetical protein